jgi:putative transposase
MFENHRFSSHTGSMTTNEVKKGNHCAYQTHYHIVFPVKYRKALLSKEIEIELVRIVREIEMRYDLEMEKMGADLDHIHLLCSFHPKYSIGQVVRLYKSITAKQLFLSHPEIKKELWGGEFWTDGYYAATVGEKGSWGIVEKYIASQGHKPEDINLRLFAS